MNLYGVKVIENPLAVHVVKEARIERTAVKKRRRGWRLTYEMKKVPCVLNVRGVLYVHPTIYKQLIEQQKVQA